MPLRWKMPIYLYTGEIRLTVICVSYKQTLVAFVVICDLQMQITVIINNYDRNQLGLITQDTLVLPVYY